MTNHKIGVAAIILAAGASLRMGEPKQLLLFENRTLLRRAVDAALASCCESVVVVVGANAERVCEEVDELPVEVVFNERWSEGMGSSVRAGLESLSVANDEDLDAVVILPCDQPRLSCDVLNDLIESHQASGKPIIVSGYEEIWGVPMLFARELWPELKLLEGKRGAQSVARRRAEDVECVPFPGGAFDLDTREDYERLLAAHRTEHSR